MFKVALEHSSPAHALMTRGMDDDQKTAMAFNAIDWAWSIFGRMSWESQWQASQF